MFIQGVREARVVLINTAPSPGLHPVANHRDHVPRATDDDYNTRSENTWGPLPGSDADARVTQAAPNFNGAASKNRTAATYLTPRAAYAPAPSTAR